MPLAISDERHVERFFSYVQFTGYCWNWTGTLRDDGYGCFSAGGENFLAHRWLYEKFTAKLEPYYAGRELDHLCRNHSCVRPSHLELVTHLENCLRGSRSTATHCKYGHEYTPQTTKIKIRRGQEHRECRTCEQQRARLKYATDENFRARRLAESYVRYRAKKQQGV